MEEKKVKVMSLPPVRFSDKDRGSLILNLKNSFGFIPDEIIIQKFEGQDNLFIFSAILTKEELKKHESNRKKGQRVAEGKETTHKRGTDK